MIDTIRNTVLALLSKDNRGYITPEEFNLFARQAQLELFTMYMHNISYATYKQNNRFYGTGYTDVTTQLSEVMDKFLVSDLLQYNAIYEKFYMPGDNPSQLDEYKPYKLIRLTYDNSIEVERVNQIKILNLISSNMTAPTESYPVYVLDENGSVGLSGIQIYPNTITNNVTILYLRYPKDPKWTWEILPGGEPIFNQSAADYQDFELPLSDAANLVRIICQLAGLSIREAEVIQAMAADEQMELQQKA